MEALGLIISILGAAVLYFRLTPSEEILENGDGSGDFRLVYDLKPRKDAPPRVSIILPVRDEELRLPRCLKALAKAAELNYEVIVVDDDSRDRTRELAAQFPVKLIKAPPKPENWSGKSWACMKGAEIANASILLFIDADVELDLARLEEGIREFDTNDCDLASALPYHIAPTWWEEGLGPFHSLVLLATAPFQQPTPMRLFACGQFLMFRSRVYFDLGGHGRTKQILAEDLALAHEVLINEYNYAVLKTKNLFRVRQYESFSEFFLGWRRNLRLGLARASFPTGLDMFAAISTLTAGGLRFTSLIQVGLMIFGISRVLKIQKRLGDFHPWGAIFWPFGVGLFIAISACAYYDLMRGDPVLWKGRRYLQ